VKRLIIEGSALEDLLFWSKNDIKLLKKILELIEDIQKTPFTGKGKPELLKYQYKGYWSRRITDEHRIVYRVTDEAIAIASARFHYSD
jgi:toxin YoeB